ncbi:MAG: L-fucose-proton symporter [Peptostreptococcus russellii]
MIVLFAMISFVTGLPNPFGVILKNQFGASNFMSQLGAAANFIAYFFMGLPAGLLLHKIGYKKTALIAIVVGFIGVSIQFLSGQIGSFPVYILGAFISGFSMCMLNTVVNPMLNTLGGGGKKGNQLIQIGGTFNSLSATIVPILLGYLMGNASTASIEDANPALFIAMGIFAFVFIVLYVTKIPEPYTQSSDVSKKNKFGPLSFRHFILGAIAIFVYVGIEVGIPNIMNIFVTSPLSEGGLEMPTIVGGAFVSTYFLLMLVGRFIGASLGGRFTSKVMISTVSILGIAFIVIACILPLTQQVNIPIIDQNLSLNFIEAPISILFFILCGLCTSVMWGGIFNLAVEGLGKYTSKASGIFMLMVCGGGVLPLIQGYIADLLGFIASYWVIFCGFIYILIYALWGSKNINSDIITK